MESYFIKSFLQSFPDHFDNHLLILPDLSFTDTPEACQFHVCDFSDAAGVIAAIGSERGWTNKERAMLEEAGFIRCGMGERIMRTETAATVAGAIILNAMGKLCHPELVSGSV